MKRFSQILCTLLPLLLAPCAYAQVGVYGTLTATRVNNPTSAQSNAYGGTNTGYWATGGSLGVYYDALHLGPVSLGLDLRGSGASKAKTVLGGVRLAVHPPILPIKPYVEGLVGSATTTNIYNNSASDFAYQIVGGIDYSLLPHLDLRAIEIGGGSIPTVISTAPVGTRTMLTISSGLALHF